MDDVYVVAETPGACRSCGRNEDLRMMHCWNCATAESIIFEGEDMYGRDINGVENGAGSKSAMDKLKFLIKLGWRPPEALSSEDGSKLAGGHDAHQS